MSKTQPRKRSRAQQLSCAVSIVGSLTLLACGASSAAPQQQGDGMHSRLVSVEPETADGAEADTGDGAEADTGDGAAADTGDGAEADTGDGAEADTGNGAAADTGDGVEAGSSSPDDATGADPADAPVPAAGETDTDEDGLADSVETDTGVFVNVRNTGTSPRLKDTDLDGVSDAVEIFGTKSGVNLRAMGASPVHRNIFLEYDWFDEAFECGAHNHRPTPEMLARIDAAFAAAPVKNPDRKSGIKLIHDYGQGAAFTGGTKIEVAKSIIEGDVTAADFRAFRDANFKANRAGIFHWVLMGHHYRVVENGQEITDSSGNAEQPGTALMVTLGCENDLASVANTLMHELGHNLGLAHGGDQLTSTGDDVNYKPNYNSVMNYRYQFEGVDTQCTASGDGTLENPLPGTLDYSRGKLASLDENALKETVGLCGGKALDWNKNQQIDTVDVSTDINDDKVQSVLHDFDDWALVLARNTLIRTVAETKAPICQARPKK